MNQNETKVENNVEDCIDEYKDLAVAVDPHQTSHLSSIHKLNSPWVYWYTSRKEADHSIPYDERLKKIVEINSIEDFFSHYMFIKPASEIERNTDLSLFKVGKTPLWECCPDGACLFIRFGKNDDEFIIDIIWEKLLFALLGEQFENSSILGAVLSIRGRETIIELWFDYNKDENAKNEMTQKLTTLLKLDQMIKIYFKDNSKSIKDKSTLKNAELHIQNKIESKRRYTDIY